MPLTPWHTPTADATLVIQDSFVILHNDEKGRPLSICLHSNSEVTDESVHIFIENTDFTLTQTPPSNQPAAIYLLVEEGFPAGNSLNFTISKCNGLFHLISIHPLWMTFNECPGGIF